VVRDDCGICYSVCECRCCSRRRWRRSARMR
jgi:hypothetical protein